MMRFTVPYSDMDLYEAVRDVLRGNEIREDVHMHLVAYVAGPGLDATTPDRALHQSASPAAHHRRQRAPLLHHLLAAHQRQRDPDSPEVRRQLPERPARHAAGQGRRLRRADLPEPAGHGRRGHGRHVLHGPQGPARDAADHQRHPRVHHAHHPDRRGLPRRWAWTSSSATSRAPSCTWPTRPSSAAAATRSPRSSRWTASRSATASVGPITQRLLSAYMNVVRGTDQRFPEWRMPVYKPVTV